MPRAAPAAADDPAPRLNGDSDTALVGAARSGDRAALACLYRRYAPMVHAVLLARVTPPDADDLTQEVFVHAIRQLGTLRDAGAIGPWLATIARNCAASMLRARKGAGPITHDVASPAPPCAGSAEAGEALAAIRSLPDTYRETLMMRLVEGLTGPQIAARTGMTPGSVRVNLHRGMAMLRERLGAPSPDAENQRSRP